MTTEREVLLQILDLLWNRRGEAWCPICHEPVAAKMAESRRPHAAGCPLAAVLACAPSQPPDARRAEVIEHLDAIERNLPLALTAPVAATAHIAGRVEKIRTALAASSPRPEAAPAAVCDECKLGARCAECSGPLTCLACAPAPAHTDPEDAAEVLRLLAANCDLHCQAMLDKARENEKHPYNHPLYVGRASVYAMISKLLRQPDRLRILRCENGATPAPAASPTPPTCTTCGDEGFIPTMFARDHNPERGAYRCACPAGEAWAKRRRATGLADSLTDTTPPGASPTGDARPEPDFLDSMISAHNAEALAKATTVRCPECKGRGWHPGDCHPREECGRCDGTGRCPPAPPAETTTTTDKEK